jgi:hypothetical protein
MRTSSITALLVCFGLTLSASQPANATDRKTRLERGDVIITKKKMKNIPLPMVKAVGLVNVPPAKLWPLIDHCKNYAKTFTRVKAAKELWRKGRKVRCRVEFSMPFPLKNLHLVSDAVHTVKPGIKYRRKWTKVSGDFRINNGSWTLKPYGDGSRTLLIYKVLAVPNIGVPSILIRLAQSKAIPELYARFRKLTRAKK